MKTAAHLLAADLARSARAGAVTKTTTPAARAFLQGNDFVDGGRAARLLQPFSQSALIRSALNHVIGELAPRALKFYQGDQDLADAALDAWWAFPAWGPEVVAGRRTRLSRAQVIEDLALWLKHEGEFFLLFDESWAVAGLRRNYAALSPFVIANPQRMRAVVQGGALAAWEYVPASGRRQLFLPEEVTHLRLPNPYDDFRGVGDLQAALVAGESAFYTSAYIRDLMRNNNDEGAIIVAKNGAVIDDAQREQISADLRARRAARRAGIARDVFLEAQGGDITVERPQQAAAGAELVSTQTISREEIYLAFGVPPSMGQVKASYSIGKDSDYYQLLNRTCIPLGAKIAGALAAVASRMTGLPLEAELEWDDHPVMQAVRSERLDSAIKLWSTGWSWERINSYLDLGIDPFPGWEIPYLPFSVAPADVSGSTVPPSDPAQDPSLAEQQQARTPDVPEISVLRLALAARQRAHLRADAEATQRRQAEAAAAQTETEALKAFTCGCAVSGEGYVAQKADRPPAALAQWRSHMKDRRAQVKAFESRFGRWLQTVRAEVLRNVEAKSAAAAQRSPTQKAAAADFLFDLGKSTAELLATMRRQQTLCLDAAGQQVSTELGRQDPFKFAPTDVLQFLTDRENKLRGVPQDVFARLQRTLQEGLDAGESTADLAGRIRTECNAIDKGRAQVIAQSETAAAFGYGRDQAMRKAGIAYKAWLTSGNANVREAHLIAGETYSPDTPIPMDEPFIVDGEELMYPGDSRGSPGNVINCHCIQIAVADPSAD